MLIQLLISLENIFSKSYEQNMFILVRKKLLNSKTISKESVGDIIIHLTPKLDGYFATWENAKVI